jgi:hypothetical protein
MAMFAASDANAVLNAVLQVSNYASVTSAKIRLGSNSGTAGSTMTEITGTGYTAGGSAVTFSSASGQSSSNTGSLSWTNTSGGAWTINGLEIWDTSGGGVRHLFGTWTGAPISVANTNTFSVVVGGVSVSLV